MEDAEIIQLYWDRSEAALSATKEKYGGYCAVIAYHVLSSYEDSEECVSEVLLRAWNAIPPRRPENLKAWLGKVTRNLALDRLKHDTAQKRGEVPLALEELELSGLDTAESALDGKLLSDAIASFLRSQPEAKRRLFLLRYWYFESIADIAAKTGWTENRIKVELFRLRKKLAVHLEKEGFSL